MTGWPCGERGTVNGPRERKNRPWWSRRCTLSGCGEEAARLVLDDGVVLPGVPVAEHDLHELVGAVVAQIVLDHLVAAHVLRLAVVERGDHVPGGAAVASSDRAWRTRAPHGTARSRSSNRSRRGRGARSPCPMTVSTVTASSFTQRMPCWTVCAWSRPYMSGIDSRSSKKARWNLPASRMRPTCAVVVRRPGVGARLRMAPGARQIGAVLRLQEGDQGHLAHGRCP